MAEVYNVHVSITQEEGYNFSLVFTASNFGGAGNGGREGSGAMAHLARCSLCKWGDLTSQSS